MAEPAASAAGASTLEGVVATFIIDWPTLMIIGFLFARATQETDWWRSRAFVAGAVTAAAFALVALISYAVAPDWMWMYFLDPDEVSWSVPLMPLFYLFVYAFSFGAAVAFRGLGSSLWWASLAMCVGLQAAVIAITWDRYHLVGSIEEWAGGAANELFSASPDGDARTISMLGPIFVAVAALSFYLAWKDRREAPADR